MSVPLPSPLALWTFVTSMRSSIVSGGNMPGILRASMVFPEPGGPLNTINGRDATYLRLRVIAAHGREAQVAVALG